MRTTTLLSMAAGVFLGVLSYAQIPNAGFESWTYQALYEQPNEYFTTVIQSFFTAEQPNVSKVAGYSGYGVRLETIDSDQGTLPGGLFLGIPGPGGITGGYPFTETPDSLVLWARYGIQPGDEAAIGLLFFKEGFPLAFNVFPLTGSEAAFIRLSFPLQPLAVEPDTVVFAVYSSSPESMQIPGTWVEFDEVELIHSTQQLPNRSFEFWTEAGSQEPDAWWTTNAFNFFFEDSPKVTRTTDSYSGDYAARIETFEVDLGGGPSLFGYMLLNAHIGEGGPVGGIPYFLSTLTPELSGYYKYAPVGNDSALVYLQFTKYNAVTMETDSLGTFFYHLPGAASYTPFAFQPTLSVMPDTVLVGFAASDIASGTAVGEVGSVVYVDAVKLSDPAATADLMPEVRVRLFPNPAREEAVLSFEGLEVVVVQVFDLHGRMIAGFHQPQSPLLLDLGNLEAGSYFVRIVGVEGTALIRLVVTGA